MNRTSFHRPKARPGALLILTMLVSGAVALAVSLSIALHGIRELHMGYSGYRSFETRAAADGCMEDALRHLWADFSYTGSLLSVGDGSCVIAVTGTGTIRNVAVSATIDRWTRKLVSGVDVAVPRMMLLQWKQSP